MKAPGKGRRVKRRNSQFGVFFGHGSVGEHEAAVGAEQSAVSDRGHGAASRRPPVRAKQSGLQGSVRLFHKKTTTLQAAKKKSQVCIYRRHSKREY